MISSKIVAAFKILIKFKFKYLDFSGLVSKAKMIEISMKNPA